MISPPGRLILSFSLLFVESSKFSYEFEENKTNTTPASFPLGCLRSAYFSSPRKGIQVAQGSSFQREYIHLNREARRDVFNLRNLLSHLKWRGMKNNKLSEQLHRSHQTAWCLKLSVMKGVLQRGSNKRLMKVWVSLCFWRQEIKIIPYNISINRFFDYMPLKKVNCY